VEIEKLKDEIKLNEGIEVTDCEDCEDCDNEDCDCEEEQVLVVYEPGIIKEKILKNDVNPDRSTIRWIEQEDQKNIVFVVENGNLCAQTKPYKKDGVKIINRFWQIELNEALRRLMHLS
jgi:hypothetical protein